MTLDPRTHAYRDDLAAESLRGLVGAMRFVTGEPRQVCVPKAGVHGAPDETARIDTETIFGETVTVYDECDGWSWGQLAGDGYVGYVRSDQLREPADAPTHRVCVPATLVYSAADLKSQPAMPIYMNSLVAVTAIEGDYGKLPDGRYIMLRHLTCLSQVASDPVAIMRQFVHVPYLWGGKTHAGLDCSGLVQTAWQACGLACPRDSDMMEAFLGAPLPSTSLGGLRCGDLIFWDGHVAVMIDGENLIHANGHHMAVAVEPAADAVSRIAQSFGEVTGIRRP